MSSPPDLVVVVGTGAGPALIDAALAQLGPSVQRSGVRPVDADEEVPVGGAPLLVTRSGPPAAPIDPSDLTAFCSIGVDGVARLVERSGASRARVVLVPQRQDRLLENAYRAAVRAGSALALAEQFPRRFEQVLDFRALLDGYAAIAGVRDVRVVPLELIGAGPEAFVRPVLDELGSGGEPDLAALAGWRMPREYGPRGLRIARAMNAHLDTEAERAFVRDHVLENFSLPVSRDVALLRPAGRRRILELHREVNRAFFAACAPGYPTGAYDEPLGLPALGELLVR